jgi:hypothetical protein
MERMNDNELLDELIIVYEKFVNNPNDMLNLDKISKLDRQYGGIGAANNYLKLQPISSILSMASGSLTDLWTNPFDKPEKEIFQRAKEILIGLTDLKNTL